MMKSGENMEGDQLICTYHEYGRNYHLKVLQQLVFRSPDGYKLQDHVQKTARQISDVEATEWLAGLRPLAERLEQLHRKNYGPTTIPMTFGRDRSKPTRELEVRIERGAARHLKYLLQPAEAKILKTRTVQRKAEGRIEPGSMPEELETLAHDLPDEAYALGKQLSKTEWEIVTVRKWVNGYFHSGKIGTQADVNKLNELYGIAPEQAETMLTCSALGWTKSFLQHR